MEKNSKRSVIGISVALVLAAVMAWAGSRHGVEYKGAPVFLICVFLAFVINWIVFVPQYLAQSEHYYDLTGSMTYLSVTATALFLVGRFDPRAVVIATLVTIWAVRLGSFLFLRIKKVGKDRRFDEIKPDGLRFFMAWTLQALWVVVTLGAGLAAITAMQAKPADVWLYVGLLVWIAGFAIEVIADRQKTAHRNDPAKQGQFISSGLWAWSRHPNYFGEVVLWLGIAIIAFPALTGWQHLTLISPLFVYLLIAKVSGVPMLEERADAQWGNDPAYQRYKEKTPEFFLKPPQ